MSNYKVEISGVDTRNLKVLTSEDSWFGVTYKEDKPSVVAKIQSFKDQGLYPFDLWKK